jgi:hypothetical protein
MRQYGRIVERDKRETSARHRDHLAVVVEEHGPTAAELDVDALEADIGVLPPKLRIVLTATKDGMAAKAGNPAPLFDVYAAAKARKGPRARPALTPNGRARRLEWPQPLAAHTIRGFPDDDQRLSDSLAI